jgi:hypothetical protein
VIHLLDAEHLRRRHANTTHLRHDMLLVGEPRHQLTGDAHDDGARGRQLDAVRLVHPATREANELLDLGSALLAVDSQLAGFILRRFDSHQRSSLVSS